LKDNGEVAESNVDSMHELSDWLNALA